MAFNWPEYFIKSGNLVPNKSTFYLISFILYTSIIFIQVSMVYGLALRFQKILQVILLIKQQISLIL